MTNSKQKFPIAYSSLIALGIVVLVIFWLVQQHYNQATANYQAKANKIYEQVAKRIGKLEELTLEVTRHMQNLDTEITAFSQFSRRYLQEKLEIDFIAYAERVGENERPDFENRIRESRHPYFTITEYGLNEYQAAKSRDHYFSIRDIEPEGDNTEQSLGLDVYSIAPYRNGILYTIQSGDVVVVPPLRHQSGANRSMVFLNLNRRVVQSNNVAVNPWSGILGVVMIQVNIDRMLAGIQLPDNWELSFEHSAPKNSGVGFLSSTFRYTFTPELNNYKNHIYFTASTPISLNDLLGSSIGFSVTLLFLVLVVCLYLVRYVVNRTDNLLADTQQVQALVDAKTKELEDEKMLLHAEIEERHRLEKQSIYFSRILDQTSNEIYMFSVDTFKFIKVNQGALKNLGYTMDEMRNMTAVDIKPEYDMARFEAAVKPLLDGKQNRLVFETIHCRKDDSRYPVEVRLQIVHGDEPIFVAVIEDISERYRVMQNMRKLSSVVEASGDIVFITDTKGVIEYVNPAFEQTTGYRASEALGRKPSLLNSFKQDVAFYKNMWSRITSGEIFHGVIINRKKSGELYYEEKTITPIRKENGDIINFVSTGKDITDREMARQQMQEKNKQLELEIIERESIQEELRKHRAHLAELVDQRTLDLAKARDDALEASSAKTRFLMSMSHELRTPLNAIIGYSELILDELGGSNEQLVTDVEKITLSGQHLLGLINDLLDLSRVEVGKLELQTAEYALQDLLKSVEYAVQPLMAKNHNRFIVRSVNSDLRMLGDVKRVRQVLMNLVANAGKFTDRGQISLQVNLLSENNQDWIEYRVKDTGIGIAADKIERLFQEFSQADQSISHKYGGTGLGLAISQKLCETMGGSITVSSEVGKGSEFVVMLPYQPSDSVEQAV